MSAERVTPWIKATASDTGGNCIELQPRGDLIAMCDSKDPVLPHITKAELAAFIDGAIKGEFDHVLD